VTGIPIAAEGVEGQPGHPLDCLFAPRSVVLVGASEDRERAGGRLVSYMTGNGYGGRVYFVNPARSTIFGQPCYKSVSELPETVDLALVALNARLAVDVVPEIGRCGVGAAVVFASGFAELGHEGSVLQQRLASARDESGIRILGPNTAGVRVTNVGLFGEQGTNLGTVGFRPGSVAMVSQSGALGGYFGSTYPTRIGVGTRYFVDTGNEIDLDAADCVDYIARDPAVSCISLILETCSDGRKLAGAVRRAVALGKPVLALKLGRSAAGMRAAASHTAAVASPTELFESELAAAGAFVTRDESQLSDAMLLHASGSAPAGNRVGVVTPSGGFGVLILDHAAELGLEVPAVPPPPDQMLSGTEVGLGGMTNPLEVAGLAASGRPLLDAALAHMSAQPNIDSVILWHPHRLLDEREREANVAALIESRQRSGKPHFHCGMTTAPFAESMRERGVLTFALPRALLNAIAAAARTPGTPAPVRVGGPGAGHPADLAPAEARSLLQDIGVEMVETRPVRDAEDALAACESWNVPVFLKLETKLASHKTERGLVRGPLTISAVRAAFDDLARSPLHAEDPGSEIVIQPLVPGIELALGAYLDPLFGPAVMVAQGGIFVEVFRDVRFAAAPVERDRALDLISSLRAYPALAGTRGTPADIDAVADALIALSRYAAAAARPGFSVDINPLIVRPRGGGAVGVDARVQLGG
jgi:acyl-CoA synthetase (NDP forming)